MGNLNDLQCQREKVKICPAVDDDGNPLKNAGKPIPHFLNDGDGLLLRISAEGKKSWILRYRQDGKRHDMGLGKYPRYSLADARAKARKFRRDIDDGVNVVAVEGVKAKRRVRVEQQRQIAAEAATRKTFRECAEEFLNGTAAERDALTQQNWHQSLGDYVYPVIGNKGVSEIDTPEILECLTPHWLTKTNTMMKVRGRIELILAYATTHGYRKGDNPARWKGHLETSGLANPAKITKVQNRASLPFAEMPAFMAELRAVDGAAARALDLLILTGLRTDEVLEAPWSEFDLDAATWSIPAERMKMERDHIVPLCERAVAILRALPRTSDRVFPTLNPKSMYTLIQKFHRTDVKGNPITVHGFRSTFRTWGQDATTFAPEVLEHCVAHIEGSSSAKAYARGDALDKRREVMTAWESFCEPETVRPCASNAA